ncbi:MAG: metal ABC transporter substrate-binding protein, partial [Dehalococcoidia bacterium]
MSWRARITCALAIVGLVGLAAACGDGDSTTEKEGQRPKVVVSLPLLADLVREVGAERTDVSTLLSPGADPHTFEPTPRDAQRLGEADLVFINGLGLEAALERVIQANVPSTVSVIRLAEEAGALPDADPHLWLSVENTTAYLNAVLSVLSEADPEGADRYRDNLDRYSNRLSELDGEVQRTIAAIPPE